MSRRCIFLPRALQPPVHNPAVLVGVCAFILLLPVFSAPPSLLCVSQPYSDLTAAQCGPSACGSCKFQWLLGWYSRRRAMVKENPFFKSEYTSKWKSELCGIKPPLETTSDTNLQAETCICSFFQCGFLQLRSAI